MSIFRFQVSSFRFQVSCFKFHVSSFMFQVSMAITLTGNGLFLFTSKNTENTKELYTSLVASCLAGFKVRSRLKKSIVRMVGLGVQDWLR